MNVVIPVIRSLAKRDALRRSERYLEHGRDEAGMCRSALCDRQVFPCPIRQIDDEWLFLTPRQTSVPVEEPTVEYRLPSPTPHVKRENSFQFFG